MISREQWYKNPQVQQQIINQLYDTELAFLDKATDNKQPTIRHKICHHYTILDWMIFHSTMHIIETPTYNLYRSLAHISREYPIMSNNPEIRTQQKEQVKKNYDKYVTGFDYGIDIDGETIQDSVSVALRLVKMLDEYKVPYELKFSGNRGFHFLIPDKYLPIMPFRQRTETLLYNLTQTLMGIFTVKKDKDFVMVIDESMTDLKRLWKIIYSWDRGLIAKPLSTEELKNFSIELVKPENVINRIYPYGLFLRTHLLSTAELRDNTASFIKDFS